MNESLSERRRKYIVKWFEGGEQAGPLSFKEVITEFEAEFEEGTKSEWGLGTFYNDAKVLKSKGLPIVAKSGEFRYSNESLSWIERRMRKGINEKREIGKVALSILAPRPEDRRLILKTIEGYSDSERNLGAALTNFWAKAARLIAFNSGTHTSQIAKEISGVETCDGKRSFDALRILTNSNLIKSTMVDRRSQSRNDELTMVGGVLNVDSGAVAGNLALKCLENWNIIADIGVLGAASLNEDFRWTSDFLEEADFGEALLKRCRIKCIAMGTHQLLDPDGGSPHPFATMSADDSDMLGIDFLITDSQIRMKQENRRSEERRQQILEIAKASGVPIIS